MAVNLTKRTPGNNSILTGVGPAWNSGRSIWKENKKYYGR